MPGSAISAAEVTHISKHGFWLLLGVEELFVPFSGFPWFRHATIDQLQQVLDALPAPLEPMLMLTLMKKKLQRWRMSMFFLLMFYRMIC